MPKQACIETIRPPIVLAHTNKETSQQTRCAAEAEPPDAQMPQLKSSNRRKQQIAMLA